jgi:hypothetical protein
MEWSVEHSERIPIHSAGRGQHLGQRGHFESRRTQPESQLYGPVILGKPGRWYDPNAFLLPLAGTFGNVARGSFIGPGFWNLDTSLAKKFNVTEQVNMQFRAEAFNVFNHPNFASPNPLVFSGNNYNSSAGSITATSNASRQIQFALKLLF